MDPSKASEIVFFTEIDMQKGHTFMGRRRQNGTGSVSDGRMLITVAGKQQLKSRVVAEKALGKPLPKGAVVHHIDENPLNNTPTNLVICPNASYHRLLHYRMRALAACGSPDKKQCLFCKAWDLPERVKYNKASQIYFHNPCRQKYRKERGYK
jgi:HNH endonuclease